MQCHVQRPEVQLTEHPEPRQEVLAGDDLGVQLFRERLAGLVVLSWFSNSYSESCCAVIGTDIESNVIVVVMVVMRSILLEKRPI